MGNITDTYHDFTGTIEAKQNNAEENNECGTGNRHTGLIIPQVRNQDTGKQVKKKHYAKKQIYVLGCVLQWATLHVLLQQ